MPSLADQQPYQLSAIFLPWIRAIWVSPLPTHKRPSRTPRCRPEQRIGLHVPPSYRVSPGLRLVQHRSYEPCIGQLQVCRPSSESGLSLGPRIPGLTLLGNPGLGIKPPAPVQTLSHRGIANARFSGVAVAGQALSVAARFPYGLSQFPPVLSLRRFALLRRLPTPAHIATVTTC